MLQGPYARISVLRPHDGDTVDFEAGYIRHLDWHRQAKDTWTWYGWTIWAGERQRWLVYPAAPADDELDNVLNVIRHAAFVGSGLFEYLPALSRGTATPQPMPRLEFTTVDLAIGAEKNFEAEIGEEQSRLQGETLWFRMIAGGPAPRFLRLRPRPNLSAILDVPNERALPESVNNFVAKTTIEILTLRPTMSYGLEAKS